jgi:hypothetical protein
MKILEQFNTFREDHPHIITTSIFLSGFLFDIFTIGRIDDFFNFVAHFLYLSLLIYLFTRMNKTYESPRLAFIDKYSKDIFHFLSGGLLSAFTIFFILSSSITQSFIFIIFVLILLILNEAETFQKGSDWLKLFLVQFCISSFLIIYLPVIFGLSGTFVFIVATLLASLILPLTLKKLLSNSYNHSIICSAFITITFITMYFLNFIPPVPLSVKEIGVFHNVKKINNTYHLYKEVSPLKFWSQGDQDFKAQEGDKVYIYARIFAPKRFKEKVYVQWERWNKDWRISDKIPLTITGGNNWGYKAYTYKKNYSEGLWRARVVNDNGKELGRINFQITKVEDTKKREWQIDIKK